MKGLDLETARLEEMRWLILRSLDGGRPVGLSESILRNMIEPCIPDLTEMELRRELDYLEERGLIMIIERTRPIWFAKINDHGIDVVKGTVKCYPGIARPRDW